jgi:helix-turn-helix protein
VKTTNLNLIPSLNDLILDPLKVEVLTSGQAQEILFKICGLIPILSVRISQTNILPTNPQEELITIKQTAEILKISPDWIYRNKASLPYITKVGGSIRVNRAKLNKAIRENRIY